MILFFDIDKRYPIDVIMKCWNSLQLGLNYKTDRAVILCDNEFKDINAESLLDFSTTGAVLEYYTEKLSKENIIKSYLANNSPEDIVYYSKANYLYLKEAIDILKSILKKHPDFVCDLFDNPDDYGIAFKWNLTVLEDRHWRSKLSDITNDNFGMTIKTLSSIYTKTGTTKFSCLIPMPSLATRVETNKAMAPLVPWTNVWNRL